MKGSNDIDINSSYKNFLHNLFDFIKHKCGHKKKIVDFLKENNNYGL